jgi:hypothetical protein
MPKQVIKHQCLFCTKSWVSKTRAEEHEAKCLYNPAVKSCSTCKYAWDKRSDDFYIPEDIPWCVYFEKEIYVKRNPISNCPVWLSREEDDDDI